MKNYATTGLWQKTDPEINRKPIDELLSLIDMVREHLLDPVAFLDKEETRDTLLKMQELCGLVAADIAAVLKRPI